jgi:hypothetical protein
MKNKQNFIFINKSLYFPEEKVLAIGDLHLGYEEMLKELGLSIPETQVKQTLDDLAAIFWKLFEKNMKIEKIVFLGDIKHFFSYEKEEKFIFYKVLDLLKKYVKEENIILIRGNHDRIKSISGHKFRDWWGYKGIAFVHGDILFEKAFDKEINTIVMGHLHPSIMLSDKKTRRKEKYRCFLVGKWKKKQVIVVPSFLPMIEGASLNSYDNDFSIIPQKEIIKFNVFVIGEKNEVFEFGRLGKFV